jgi:hypothetical protein
MMRSLGGACSEPRRPTELADARNAIDQASAWANSRIETLKNVESGDRGGKKKRGRKPTTDDIAEFADKHKTSSTSWKEVASKYKQTHPDDDRVPGNLINARDYVRDCHRRWRRRQ